MIQFETYLKETDKLLEEGEYEAARRILFQLLRMPEYQQKVYDRTALCLRMLGSYNGAQLFEKVIEDPNEPAFFYNLGTELCNQGFYGSALGPLYNCIQLAKDFIEVNVQMGLALFKEGLYPDSRVFLERAVALKSPIISYLLGNIALFTRDIQKVKFYEDDLEALVAEGIDGAAKFKELLSKMRIRYEFSEPVNLRDWHFVQYGKMLLKLEIDDTSFPDDRYSSGRYWDVDLTYRQVGYIVRMLIQLLKETVKCEYIAAANENMIPVTKVIADLLGIQEIDPNEAIAKEEYCLIVGETNNDFLKWKDLLTENNRVVLFAFSLEWSTDAPIVPDIVGYMAKYAKHPWGVDVSNEEGIYNAVKDSADLTDNYFVNDLVGYFRERTPYLDIGEKLTIPRRPFGIESPVIEVQG